MQSPTANHPAIGFDISEPLPLVKSESLCIDLSDLLGLKTLKTSHSMSTNDSVSAKADEDTTKSVASGEIEFSPVVSVPVQSEKRITIKDIISKRAYTRRSNDNKNVGNDSQITSNNKKRLADLDGNTEEIIIKKEKLDEKKEFQGITASQDNKCLVPELVFKDGKVQIAAPSSFEGGEIVKQELEVVHVGKKKVTMSTSFKQVTHTEKWTEKETEKFYRALELFGTDFSMIAKVFKTRNRNQIKNKFLREEKTAAEKVDTTLKRLKPNNFQVLFRKFEKLKKVQKAAEKTTLAENNIKINLLFPTQKTINPQGTKQDEIEIQIRARNERSGSFHSTTSVDSMDRAIIEDLADILMPKNNLLGMCSTD